MYLRIGLTLAHVGYPQRADLDPDEHAKLEPGRQYIRQVVALDAEGEDILRAPAQSFVGCAPVPDDARARRVQTREPERAVHVAKRPYRAASVIERG